MRIIVLGFLGLSACGTDYSILTTDLSAKHCSARESIEGVIISCPGSADAIVRNGVDGINGIEGEAGAKGEKGDTGEQGEKGDAGEQGESGTPGTVVTMIIPCPELPGAHPEQLMCINDTLYAVFAPTSGNQIRLVELLDNTNYVTTDNRSCYFRTTNNCILQ